MKPSQGLLAYLVGGDQPGQPGGETTDSLVVWLPDDATVFTGNLFGPILGHVPNLYTIRGDKLRSALEYIRTVDRVRALDPEVMVHGRSEPVHGQMAVADWLTRLRDAVQYLHDATVAGMNEGKDLFTLMREITLPQGLTLGQGHGKIAWDVRAIWEEYTGWFRYESTTELYWGLPRALGEGSWVGRRTRPVGNASHPPPPTPAPHQPPPPPTAPPRPLPPSCADPKKTPPPPPTPTPTQQGFSEVRWLEQEIAAALGALSRPG